MLKQKPKDSTAVWSFAGFILNLHFALYKVFELEIDLHGMTPVLEHTIRVVLSAVLVVDMVLLVVWYLHDRVRDPRNRVRALRLIHAR